jgi:predicted DCC family thiol-disulfide oxidoreductase YuxK
MKNGWTAGQYSLYRAVFGGYLFVHYCSLVVWGPELFSSAGVLPNPWTSPLARLFPNILVFWDSPGSVQFVLILAAGMSVLFAIGLWDRVAAVTLWYVSTCLVDRNPLITNPALPFLGWLLLAHALLPKTPYLSLSVRDRDDAVDRWRMPPELYAAAWLLMAVGYTYSGLNKLGSPSWLDGSALTRILASPLARPGLLHVAMLHVPTGFLRCASWSALALEIGFAPLSLVRRARPWIWSGMCALHLSLFLLVAFPDLTAGMLILHIFTFEPSWLPAMQPSARENIFYDGSCGLCHWAVRFVIGEDTSERKFRFAPLGGKAFESLIPAAQRVGLPDSLVVLTTDGRILVRAAAAIHILRRLGGVWICVARLLRFLPRPIADSAYDFIARSRYRLFSRTREACLIIPTHLLCIVDSRSCAPAKTVSESSNAASESLAV